MKMYVKKTLSSLQRERIATGGGPRPPSPSNEIKEIVDLLNPADLLTDINIYDSDSVVLHEPVSMC